MFCSVSRIVGLAAAAQIARLDQIQLDCVGSSGLPDVAVFVAYVGSLDLGQVAKTNAAVIAPTPTPNRPLPSDMARVVSVVPIRLPAVLVTWTFPSRFTGLDYFLVHDRHAYNLAYQTQPTPNANTLALIRRSARSFSYT